MREFKEQINEHAGRILLLSEPTGDEIGERRSTTLLHNTSQG